MISLVRIVVPSSNIVINLPRTSEKLHCKGELYRSTDHKLCYALYKDYFYQMSLMGYFGTHYICVGYSRSPIKIHKITPSAEYNYRLKRLDTLPNELTNQNFKKVPKVVEQKKTLGTCVINSLMSPPSVRLIYIYANHFI